MTDEKERKAGGNILDRIFPPRYDFEGMLTGQARQTLRGVEVLVGWLEKGASDEPDEICTIEAAVDAFRYEMEDKLRDAFSTPFDRQDIYRLSRQMDYILNFSCETAREMHVFGVSPDRPVLVMARALLDGTREVAAGVERMGSEPGTVQASIRQAREAIRTLDDTYIAAMDELFRSGEAIDAMKRREIYHHLRDAGRALRDTVDILHQALVGIDLAR